MALPHLLLVNLGTPDAPTAESMRRFLGEFLSDPDVIDFPKWFWQPILGRGDAAKFTHDRQLHREAAEAL